MDQTAATAGAGRVDEEFSALPLRAGHPAAGPAVRRAAGDSLRSERGRLAVRVVVDGTWGFASAVDLAPDAAARAAAEGVAVARVAAALAAERIELASEPAHGDVTWVSGYDIDPFSVSVAEQAGLLAGWTAGLLADDRVDHVDASLLQVKECKFYSDGGTTATQQRIRVRDSSVFDNGLALAPAYWISAGRLAALVQTRHSAQRLGMAVTPAIGNLILRFNEPGSHAAPRHRGRREHGGTAARVERVLHPGRDAASASGGLQHVLGQPGQLALAPPAKRPPAGSRP